MRRGTCASACAATAAALLALALASCDRGAPAAPQPAVPVAQPAPPAAPAPAKPVDSGDIDPGPGERVFWQVADADGVRFYDDIERVPEALRAKARAISLGPASDSAAAAPPPPAPAAPATAAAPASASVTEAPALPAARDPDAAGRPARETAVVVYTTAWCPWCRKTLAWLDEQGVAYVNKDIERNLAWRRELIEKTGQAAIPVVEIDDQIIRGFDPDRMEQLL
jgi:glutaredoxin